MINIPIYVDAKAENITGQNFHHQQWFTQNSNELIVQGAISGTSDPVVYLFLKDIKSMETKTFAIKIMPIANQIIEEVCCGEISELSKIKP